MLEVSELHPARLQRLLETERVGRVVILLEKVGSTNSFAFGVAENGVPEGTLVVAEEQMGGRGRKGRSWFSCPGKSLTCSLVIKPTRGNVGLTPLFALSTAEAIDTIITGTGIKWPNDIYVAGMKAGGILAEAKRDTVVIGLGFNVNEREADFPEELKGKVSSLSIASGDWHDRGVILARIGETFERNYDRWEREGFTVFRERVERRMLFIGEDAILEGESERFAGKVLGITAEGYLRMEVDGKEAVFSSGDLTLRGGQ